MTLTLSDILSRSTEYLKERGCVRPRRAVEELLEHLLKIKRLDLYMQFDRPMQEDELARLRPFLKRAAAGEPVEYILGEVEFYHCRLRITPAVLIPRPETEILVDRVCRDHQEVSLQGKTAWDICSGSGYIGISLKKRFPELSMTLVDLSADAVALARENAESNQVEVEVLEGDLLAPLAGRQADLVVCNPPYISTQEYFELDPSVRLFEPKLALVGGEDGLEFYRRLNRELPPFLRPSAKLYFEIGKGQGDAVLSLFQEPCWKQKRIEKDWAGHDRFFFLEFQ